MGIAASNLFCDSNNSSYWNNISKYQHPKCELCKNNKGLTADCKHQLPSWKNLEKAVHRKWKRKCDREYGYKFLYYDNNKPSPPKIAHKRAPTCYQYHR